MIQQKQMPKLEDEKQVDSKSTSKMMPQRETDLEQEPLPSFSLHWGFLHWGHAKNTLEVEAILQEYLAVVHPAFYVFLDWAAAKEDEIRTQSLLREHVFILPKEEDRLRLIGCLSENRRRLVLEIYKNMLVKDDHNNKFLNKKQETPSKTASTNTPN
jgi:hypothetical protein